jgi:hypothetical protein
MGQHHQNEIRSMNRREAIIAGVTGIAAAVAVAPAADAQASEGANPDLIRFARCCARTMKPLPTTT